MYQTYNTGKRRWSRVKDFINYTQPNDLWVDTNTHIRKLTKSLIEDTMDEEMISYQKRNDTKEPGNAWIIGTAITGAASIPPSAPS